MKRLTSLRVPHMAAAVALLLGGGVAAASAQTTVITTQPGTTGAVVTTQERLELSPVQRQTIYRTIVRERSAPGQGTVEYRVGTRIPDSATLYAVPQDIAVEVPAVKSYKYMVVNNRVLLIDPATSQVVAEVMD